MRTYEVFARMMDKQMAQLRGEVDQPKKVLPKREGVARDVEIVLSINPRAELTDKPSMGFENDPWAWKVIEDREADLLGINAAKIGLVQFAFGKRAEVYVPGDSDKEAGRERITRQVMIERTSSLLGQRTAEFLISNQTLIPESWRQYRLLFPGLVWNYHGGGEYISELHWFDFQSRWELLWTESNSVWFSDWDSVVTIVS